MTDFIIADRIQQFYDYCEEQKLVPGVGAVWFMGKQVLFGRTITDEDKVVVLRPLKERLEGEAEELIGYFEEYKVIPVGQRGKEAGRKRY